MEQLPPEWKAWTALAMLAAMVALVVWSYWPRRGGKAFNREYNFIHATQRCFEIKGLLQMWQDTKIFSLEEEK
jgi:hypothetical protein